MSPFFYFESQYRKCLPIVMGSETLAEKQRVHSGYELSEKGEACSRTGWAVLGNSACLKTNVVRGSETTAFTTGTAIEGGHAPVSIDWSVYKSAGGGAAARGLKPRKAASGLTAERKQERRRIGEP